MTIRIQFSRNRLERGFLAVAGTDFGCPCLGRADQEAAKKVGNPSRNPLRRNGDTPTGTYRAWIGRVILLSPRSYGPHPVIRLDPISGDALEAKRNGRSGLLIPRRTAACAYPTITNWRCWMCCARQATSNTLS